MIGFALAVSLSTLAVGIALALGLRMLPTVRLQLAGLALLAVGLPLAAVIWRTAVFKPENEKSQPGLPFIGRGKVKRCGSPPCAAASMAGPPG